MAKLTPDAEEAIKEAIRIVKEDRTFAHLERLATRQRRPAADPDEPTGGSGAGGTPPVDPAPEVPPVDPAPEVKPRKGGYWGELLVDDD